MSDPLRPHGLEPPWGSSVHGILQARILEWVAIPFSMDLPTQGSNTGLPHCRWILRLYLDFAREKKRVLSLNDIYHAWWERIAVPHSGSIISIIYLFFLEHFIIRKSLNRIRIFFTFSYSPGKITGWTLPWFINAVLFNIAKISFSFRGFQVVVY